MSEPRTLVGLGVSPGIAIGRPVVVENRPLPVARTQLSAEQVEGEVRRLREGSARAAQHLADLAKDAAKKVGAEFASILEAHRLILDDPSLVDEVEKLIRRECVNAEWALEQVTRRLVAQFEQLGDLYLRERRADVLDVALELQRALQGRAHPAMEGEMEGTSCSRMTSPPRRLSGSPHERSAASPRRRAGSRRTRRSLRSRLGSRRSSGLPDSSGKRRTPSWSSWTASKATFWSIRTPR